MFNYIICRYNLVIFLDNISVSIFILKLNMTSSESKLIASERRQCSFNVKEMTNILDGGTQKTALRHSIGRSL